MAPGKEKEEHDEGGNLLARMLEQAPDLEFTDPLAEDQEKERAQDPRRLMVEGFECVLGEGKGKRGPGERSASGRL